MKNDHKICKECVIPENFPGIVFDESGLCSLCQADKKYGKLTDRLYSLQKEMSSLINEVKKQKNIYDCIVAFSGGKDSSYTLRILVEKYGLKCLAVLVDNGFIAERALENAKNVAEYLGVDLQIFKPAPRFMNAMYRISAEGSSVHSNSAIKRASNVCNSCINVINTHMLNLAGQIKVPLIAGGYIGGQVPTDSAVLKTSFERLSSGRIATEKKYSILFGQESSNYFEIFDFAKGDVAIINPMLTVNVSEDEIIKDISTMGWIKPDNTGENSSNCLMNDFGIFSHYIKFGFNPYLIEIADQVRKGLMRREDGIRRANKIPNNNSVAGIAHKIGIELKGG